MTFEHLIYLLVGVLCTLTCVQGLAALWAGVRFDRYVAQMVSQARSIRDTQGRLCYHPPAAVILPCCGVDDELPQTVAAMEKQDYPDYEVIFTFESADDAAYPLIRQLTASWTTRPHRLVVAGTATIRSQKIHNLLAALEAASPNREVFVFLDSDAVPDPHWMAHLVAPLRDDTVGAATGYRWYSAAGGLAAGVRSAWNAATVTLLDDERLNFCWGGATAIRRETFERVGVARKWQRALSDDYQLTRAVRAAGLRIRFVPQAIVVSRDQTTLRSFLAFAARQVLITRVCAPQLWREGFLLTLNFMIGASAAAALALASAAGWIGHHLIFWAALGFWVVIILLAGGKAVVRQRALRRVLRPPALARSDFWWDVLGTITFSGALHLHLFWASLRSRRVTWRNIVYEMVSPDETRVLHRLPPP